MKFRKTKIISLTAILMALSVVSSGCGGIKFKTPEEAKVAQKNTVPSSEKKNEAVVYTVKDMVYEDVLTMPQGAQTASYYAALPQFEETGDKALILKKINEYYESEFESLKQDCQSYFKQIQTAYGDMWQTSVEPASMYGVKATYEVVKQSQDVISVLRTYKYTDVNMKIKFVYSAETFDCATGWPMKLDEMLIKDNQLINSTINEQIDIWYQASGADKSLISEFDINTKEYSFALNDDSIILCIDETGVSSNSAGAQTITIPLENIAKILKKN